MLEIKRRIIEFIEKEGIAKESFYKKNWNDFSKLQGDCKKYAFKFRRSRKYYYQNYRK